MILSSFSEKESTNIPSNTIYNSKKSWNLNFIPLSNTWKSNPKIPKDLFYSLPDYETDLSEYSDYKTAKLLRNVYRKDFTPITIEDASDLDKVVGRCGNKPVCLKHSHLIAWDYELNDKGEIGYRTKRLLKGSNVLMADCDNTIPFEEFRKKFQKYRWFSRTSFGNINGEEKFHVFFLLDDYQSPEELKILTSKLSTLTFGENNIFDDAPFGFGAMLAGHYRREMKVYWNDGLCISSFCASIEIEEKEVEKIKKSSKRKDYSGDASELQEGVFKNRVGVAKDKGFLLSLNDSSACLRGKNEKTEGGYYLYANNPDWVFYYGANPEVQRFTLWSKWLDANGYGLEPFYDLSGAKSIGECVKQLETLMSLQGRGNYIYKVSAGVGKTISAIKHLMYRVKGSKLFGEVERERCLVFVPSLKLAKEMSKSIMKIHPDSKVKIIRGRTASDYPACLKARYSKRFMSIVERVGEEGKGTFSTLCKSKDRECTYYENCPYILGYSHGGEADIVIMTHNYLGLTPVELLYKQLGDFDRIIIDETFYSSLLIKKKFERKSIRSLNSVAGDNIRHLLATLEKSRPDLEGKSKPILKLLREEGVSLEAALEECKDLHYSKTIHPDFLDEEILAELDNYKEEFIDITLLIEALQKEIVQDRVESLSVSIDDSGNIYLYSKKQIVDFFRDIPITYLDASAPSKDFISALTGLEFERYEIFSEDKGTYYYENQVYARRDLIPNPKKDNKKTAIAKEEKKEDFRRLVRGLTGRVFGKKENTYKVLVCSYKKYFEEYLGDLGDNIETVYFSQGLRGVNRLQNCDIAYIIGRQTPSHQSIEQDARCIYSDTPFSLDFLQAGERYTKEWRGMETTDGKVIRVQTEIHKDNRINEVLELIREEETIQTIARLRSVRLENKKIIFSGKVVLPVKISGEVNRTTLNRTALVDSITGLEGNKVLSLHPKTLLKVNKESYNTRYYKKVDKLVRAIEKDKKRLTLLLQSFPDCSNLNLPDLLNHHLGLGIYKYKIKKQKGENRTLLTYSRDEAEVRKSLSELYKIKEEDIETLILIKEPDTDYQIRKKQYSFNRVILQYRQALLEEEKREVYYISLFGSDGYQEYSTPP